MVLVDFRRPARISSFMFPGFMRFLKVLFRRLSGSLMSIFGLAYVYEKSSYSDHSLIFSQEGEDFVVKCLIGDQLQGFYVDIGAYHPTRFSNTYLFYLRGWKGINVEPRPGSKKLFDSLRPRDLNLEIGISDCPGNLEYFLFKEPAFNTCDKELANSRMQHHDVSGKAFIPVITLEALFKAHLHKHQVIDFMSIDVEGLDIHVLKSNDWEIYRPRYIIVEDFSLTSLDEILTRPVSIYLKSIGYTPFSRLMKSMVFADV